MQTIFRGNLSAANFPLVSDFMGRSIVVPQYDENYLKKKQFSGEDSDLDLGTPQVYYCHNVMPVGQGFKSIAYKLIVRPATGVLNFTRIFPVKDPSENKAVIGVTSDGKIFIYGSGTSVWTDITAATGGWTGGLFSYAYANGYTYLCLSKFNVFKVDILNKTLTPVTLAGLTTSGVVGICSSNNYLLVHDDVTTYWSSAVNPEDFVPSLVTGAGSGIPQDLNGKIVCILPLGNGFAVYTSLNIILASYSGNLRFPWIFKQAPNGSGVIDITHIAQDADQGTNYAWTSAGILKVSSSGCTTPFPEVTDFLAGRIFEDYDPVTDTFNAQYLTDPLAIKLSFVASRYFVISYGITGQTELTHALVYDTGFKRWGKLKLAHTACFELGTNTEAQLTFNQLGTSVYSDYANIAFSELTSLSNTAAPAKRALAFLQKDGTVKLAVWDYGNYASEAVAIFGKYQLTRNRLATFQSVDIENVDADNTNFSVLIFTSLHGKNTDIKTTPTLSVSEDDLKKYSARVTGMNHSLVVKGAFNLVSFLLTFSSGGRR